MNFSYSKLLSSYQVPQAKGFFPYEKVRTVAQLYELRMASPPIENFYSALKKKTIDRG